MKIVTYASVTTRKPSLRTGATQRNVTATFSRFKMNLVQLGVGYFVISVRHNTKIGVSKHSR